MSTATDSSQRRLPWVVVGLGAAALAMGGLAVRRHLRRRTGDPILLAYAAMQEGGARLGHEPLEALTAREYAASLAGYVASTTEALGLGDGRDRVGAMQAAEEIRTIAVAYERRRYAGPARTPEAQPVVAAWHRLSRRFRGLMLRRLPVVARARFSQVARALRERAGRA